LLGGGAFEDGIDRLLAECNRLGINSCVHNDEYGSVNSIYMMDPLLAPPKGAQMRVLMSDVTFGITDKKTGFGKWSHYLMVCPDHKIYTLCVSAIKHEDTVTFVQEARFLLIYYPELAEERFVLIVDGDKAKWAAARLMFPLVLLLMCVYHGSECFKRKFGPICRSTPRALSTSIQPPAFQQVNSPSDDMWIACDKCNKWRLLEDNFDITQYSNRSFFCSDISLNCSVPSSSTFEVDSAVSSTDSTLLKERVEKGSDEEDIEEVLLTEEDETVIGNAIIEELIRAANIPDKKWFVLWSYIKNGPTLIEVRARLDAVVKYYPTSAEYVSFLWQNVRTWAKCCSTWHQTYDLHSSALSENLHHSWKSRLGKQLIVLQEVPSFFRQVMQNRQLSRGRKRLNYQRTLKADKADACSKGCSQLVNLASVYLTDECCIQLFRELHISHGQYTLRMLNGRNEVLAAIGESESLRGASARRFKCLTDIIFSQTSIEGGDFNNY